MEDQKELQEIQTENLQPEREQTEEEKKESALLKSIKDKGQHSYYYAHAPKNYNTDGAEVFKGEGLIYGGDPVLLGQREKKELVKERPPKKITKYSWVDEDAKVKVYIELDQFQGVITDEMIDIKFEEQSLNIKIVDEQGQVNFLNLPKLHEKIEPEKSNFRKRSNKIIITLHKWLETKWRDLTRA